MRENTNFQPAPLPENEAERVDELHLPGLSVVAEGIESYDQLVYLHAYHCEEGQGYYFSMPLEANMLLQRTRDNRQ